MCISLDAIKEKRVTDVIMVYSADKYSPNKPMDHFVGKDISSPAELM